MSKERTPVLFLLFPFSLGILVHPLFTLSSACFFSSVLLLFQMLLLYRGIPYGKGHWPGILLLLVAFFLGSFSAELEKEGNERKPIPEGEEREYVLKERLGANEWNLRFIGETRNSAVPVLLKLERGPAVEALLPGDRIVLKADPRPIPAPLDTADLDLRSFYASRGVHYQVEGEQVKLLESAPRWDLWTTALRYREILYRRIRDDTPLEGDELAVASALWLGRKSELPDELREKYADAGGMHVLAVSGLHVGMIFLLLQGSTLFLRRFGWGRLLRPFIILLALWAYAALTGWSASVVRAVLMGSLYTLGQFLERPPHIANVIGGSAFLILLFKPSMLTDVGFLLSYSAVIAIVSIYPFLERLFYSRWAFLRWSWSVLSVSFAAQLGVLPVLLFAFGKFPLWFELTNPLLLPLASLALYSGVPMSLSFLVPGGPEWVGYPVSFIFQAMNLWVAWVAGLPGSGLLIQGFTLIPAVLLAVFIFLVLLKVQGPSIPYWCLQIPLTALLLFLFHQEKEWREQECSIHHGWDRVSVLSVRRGKQVDIFSSRDLDGYRESILREFWKERGVERVRTSLYGAEPWESASIRIGKERVLFWNGPLKEFPDMKKAHWDLAVLGRYAKKSEKGSGKLGKVSTLLLLSEKVPRPVWSEAFVEAPDSVHRILPDRTYVARL